MGIMRDTEFKLNDCLLKAESFLRTQGRTVLQLTMKCSAMYETWSYTALFAKLHRLSLSWARWLHSTPWHPINTRSLLLFPPPTPRSSMLPVSLRLPDQNSAVYAVLFSLMCVTCPAHPIVLDSITQCYWLWMTNPEAPHFDRWLTIFLRI